jgi:Na+/H+ antiporter NhaC
VSLFLASLQFSALVFGCCLFFDDSASTLMVGFSMQPLFDPLSISREKLAFISDAVSAPIASISPISSWVGYEVDLIGAELEKIKEVNGGSMPEGLSESAFSVFLETIPYRYYPFFMLFFQIFLIATQREFGPMLIAERKCVVHKRTDGGDGSNNNGKENQALKMANLPEKGTPYLWWNMVVPVLVLVGLIIAIMYNIGLEAAEDSGLENPSLSDIFGLSDAYVGLLYGTFGTAVITLIFYGLQFTQNNKLTWPKLNLLTFKKRTSSKETITNDIRESIANIKQTQVALEGDIYSKDSQILLHNLISFYLIYALQTRA